MATKKKAPEKAKKKAPKMVVTSETGVTTREESFLSSGTGIGDRCEADKAAMHAVDLGTRTLADGSTIPMSTGLTMLEEPPPPPAALTLPLVADTATMFLRGAQELTAQLLGQPECAPLLVKVHGWLKELEKIKLLITGNEDEISGLKAKVITDGTPWGEKGSKQLTLAGAVVKVKAVNHRDENAAPTIADLDAAKLEAYMRGIAPESALASYMKGTTVWGLKDLSPVQQANLTKLLADPGEYGQGVRQCLKTPSWTMMAPEMEGA